MQEIARLFPVHYAIVLEQFAFKGFTTNTLGLLPNSLVLCGFTLGFVLCATLAMRFSRIAH